MESIDGYADTAIDIQGVTVYVCKGGDCRHRAADIALKGDIVLHEDSGAPYAADSLGARRGYYISISHTCDICVIAVSDAPVGVDIERLDRTPPKGFADIWAWTDTEAYVKAGRQGLRMSDVRYGGIACSAQRRVIDGIYALSVYKGNA
ncbi:MAG: hypothetical protein K2I79_05305 [Clostridia bacterium]|nr:hypothetical protein [Clostridia bacterium]